MVTGMVILHPPSTWGLEQVLRTTSVPSRGRTLLLRNYADVHRIIMTHNNEGGYYYYTILEKRKPHDFGAGAFQACAECAAVHTCHSTHN